MRNRLRAFTSILVLLMIVMPGHAQEQTLEERANEAFHQSRHDVALELYEQLLVQDPDNVIALFRTAMILSWDQRFDEALERLDEVLALEPGNLEARRQRAKILSWNGQFEAAEREFSTILDAHPSDAEALLGHARVLSWSGRQADARAGYEQVLSVNGRDASATVGVAQTWAWSGHPRKAAEWYRKALAIEPEMMAARLGLGHLAIAGGDLRTASEIASALSREFPEDPDVADLAEAVERARSPWYAGSFERVTDTEENELDISRIEAGWSFPSRIRMVLGVTRFDMTGPNGEGTIDSPTLTTVWTPNLENRFTIRVGADFAEQSDGEDDSELIGGVAWMHSFPSRWSTVVAVDHDSYRYSVPILDAGITTTRYSARLNGNPAQWFRTTVGVGGADYSDDNQQVSADLGVWFRLPIDAFSLELGYVGRYLDFDQNLNNGYFDPNDFRAHIGQLIGRGMFGESDAYWAVTIESGVQSFELGPAIVDNDELFGWYATLGIPLGEALSLELNGGESDYALQSATGFESEQYSIRLRFQP